MCVYVSSSEVSDTDRRPRASCVLRVYGVGNCLFSSSLSLAFDDSAMASASNSSSFRTLDVSFFQSGASVEESSAASAPEQTK